jgi:glycosyltransferase 2 family protein
MPDPSEPHDARSHSSAPRRGLIWFLKIVVSGGLLYVLLSRVDLLQLWTIARTASPVWLATALAVYFGMVVVSAWRWGLLLHAQHVAIGLARLVRSFLVATFFNNFLPSNIGGDVIRIRDTSRAAGSKTTAATIVLLDRGIGLLGLVFVAAVGATRVAAGSEALGPIGPGMLWAILCGGIAVATPMVMMPEAVGRMLRPLQVLHHEWVGRQIDQLISALARFRAAPAALVQCFVGAIVVQGTIVVFYAAIARALSIPISLEHLAVLIPLSFIIQMAPVSVNGFGVREATFSLYFSRLQLPIESALALSFTSAVLLMVFSISGAVIYLTGKNGPA